MERVLNITAAIITIANFVRALASFSLTKASNAVIVTIPIGYLPLQLILFLAIEFTLSYTFAIVIVYLMARGQKEENPVLILPLIIITLISAWTSIFNLQWLLIGPFEITFWYIIKYIIGVVFVNAVAAGMVVIRELKIGEDYIGDGDEGLSWLL
jgi:hypothetical protein